jgi:DNA-binding CsgD family transcriptional regulator
MAQCITCGIELHPDRAKKYNYCMSPECQEKNLKSLTMVAVGVNKSAEQYMILDEQTRDDLATGKFADQRRGLIGTSVPSPEPGPATAAGPAAAARPATAVRPSPAEPARPSDARPSDARPSTTRPRGTRPSPAPSRPAASRTAHPWTRSQEKLALLYNEQGLRPEEIAQKLGLSRYTVTQIILGSTNRGKL